MITSLTSNKQASKAQMRQVLKLTTEGIGEVSDVGNLTHGEAQFIHANGGKYKKDLAEAIAVHAQNFRRKTLGIVNPLPAEQTGLLPHKWWVFHRHGVRRDYLEGEVALAEMDFSFFPVRPGRKPITGDEVLRHARGANVFGSLGLAHAILQAQAEGRDFLPVQARHNYTFLFQDTVLADDEHREQFASLVWEDEKWTLRFIRVCGGVEFGSWFRFIRPRRNGRFAA